MHTVVYEIAIRIFCMLTNFHPVQQMGILTIYVCKALVLPGSLYLMYGQAVANGISRYTNNTVNIHACTYYSINTYTF